MDYAFFHGPVYAYILSGYQMSMGVASDCDAYNPLLQLCNFTYNETST